MKKSKLTFGFTPTPNFISRCSSLSFSKHKLKSNWVRGFTLIEVLVVIAIIASLSALIYTSFGGARTQSRDQKRVADLSSIQLSLELYLNKNKQYPVKLEDLVLEKFVQSLPVPPNENEKYHYVPLSKDGTYCISYQLWTTFEIKNQYLPSKKGYDSTNQGILKWCPGYSANELIDSSKNELVYDVMP